MPRKIDSREYRAAAAIEAGDNAEQYRIAGYATTFDTPYLIATIDGVDYFEVVDRHALDEADMSDVILQFDHEGRVFARVSNGTLTVEPDDHGLRVEGDLSRSAGGRDLYADIRAGLITKMSWGFIVAEDAYDRQTRTRTIKKIKKVFDVSAVSIPANDDTDISARSYCDGVIKAGRTERFEMRAKALLLKIKIEKEGI